MNKSKTATNRTKCFESIKDGLHRLKAGIIASEHISIPDRKRELESISDLEYQIFNTYFNEYVNIKISRQEHINESLQKFDDFIKLINGIIK